MSVLVWDAVGDRVYETGLDRGVLYLPDGSAVPWNGLTSIIELFDKESSPVYYDGMKINNLITLGDFSATMKALTYPDEFLELEGLGSPRDGVFYGDQVPKSFGLSYRTRIGNDVDGDTAGYKIHILYNVTAIPHEKTYETMSGSTSPGEFEWDIFAVPEEIPGFRPTAHIIINTLDLNPLILVDLEEILYGSDITSPSLIPMVDLVSFIVNWSLIQIDDNEDGTWTATSEDDDLITMLTVDMFEITDANAVYLDADTYTISGS